MITVVIPYFQRQAGVLRKALRSIAAQRGCALAVHIIVVDDESPAPVGPETVEIAWPARMTLQVICQRNSGPGGARNAGLDAVPANADYVAFLDSDDAWSPDHLGRAVEALERGYDFYFADHLQLGQTVGAFGRANRLTLSQHKVLETPSALLAFEGDFFDQVLRGNVVGTSTVVYRWSLFARERFRVDLTSAGEDYLFWMALAQAKARVVFSLHVEAEYGKGVNVYAGSGWGTEGHLQRVQDEMIYRKSVSKRFPLNSEQQRFVSEALVQLRIAFLRDLLHRLRYRIRIPLRVLVRQVQVDVSTFLPAPQSLLKIVAGRR